MTTRMEAAEGLPRKERVPELEMLRGIAILGVMMVHATSSAVVTVQNSLPRDAYIILNTFSLFCVPAFIFLSGFVLFYNYGDRPLTLSGLRTFYAKRFLQLIVPYAFVSLGYELVENALKHRSRDSAEMLRLFGEHLLTGKAYPHLYYVAITIQLYMLFPLLLLLFQKLRLPIRLAIPLGFVVQWGFYLLNRNYWQMDAKGSWAFSYFAAFLIGAYLGMRSDRFARWFRGNGGAAGRRRAGLLTAAALVWLATSAGFLGMYIAYRSGASTPNGYWFEIGYNMFTVLTTLVLLFACFRLAKLRAARWLAGVLSDLGALSFGLYLVHPFFLLLYHRHKPASGQPLVYHLWTAGGFVFALGVSVLVLLLAHRYIRGAWLVLGQAPAKFRPRPEPAEEAEAENGQSDRRLKEATE